MLVTSAVYNSVSGPKGKCVQAMKGSVRQQGLADRLQWLHQLFEGRLCSYASASHVVVQHC